MSPASSAAPSVSSTFASRSSARVRQHAIEELANLPLTSHQLALILTDGEHGDASAEPGLERWIIGDIDTHDLGCLEPGPSPHGQLVAQEQLGVITEVTTRSAVDGQCRASGGVGRRSAVILRRRYDSALGPRSSVDRAAAS